MKNGKLFIMEEILVLEYKKFKLSCMLFIEIIYKLFKKVSSYIYRVREFRIIELILNINMCLCFKIDNFFKIFF